jgi:hypothetical protein
MITKEKCGRIGSFSFVIMKQCRLACVDLDRETAAGLLTGARRIGQ